MKLSCIGSSSKGNCYILTDEEQCPARYLILDCGAKWMDVLAGCDFNRSNEKGCIDGCLFTHRHTDHFYNTNSLKKYVIPSYGSNELSTDAASEDELWWKTVIGIPEKQKTSIKDWIVIPWYVPHTGNNNEKIPCFAYMIFSPSGYRMVYLTDFLHSPLTFKSFKVQTLLIACNHDDYIEEYENSTKFEHIVSGHSSLSTVQDIVRINKTDALRNVILCHLSDDNATPDLMHKTIQETVGENVNVFIARKGMKINL